jgi:hypothetical protein
MGGGNREWEWRARMESRNGERKERTGMENMGWSVVKGGERGVRMV